MPARVAAWELDNAHLLDEHLAAVLPESGAAAFACALTRACAEPADLEDPEDGRTPEEVATLMALLAYAYSQGVLSSRQIARECQRRLDFIGLTGAQPPSFQAIMTFRDMFAPTLGGVFARWIALACRAGFMATDADPVRLAVQWVESSYTLDTEEDARYGEDALGIGDPPWLGDARARERRLRKALEAMNAPAAPPPDEASRKPLIRAHSRSTTSVIKAFPDDEAGQLAWREAAEAARAAPAPAHDDEDHWHDEHDEPAVGHDDDDWHDEPPAAHDDWDDDEVEEKTMARAAMPDDDEPPPSQPGRGRPAPAPAPPPAPAPAPRPPPPAEHAAAASTGAAAAVEIIRHVKAPEDRLHLVEVVLGAAMSDGEVTAPEQRRVQSLIRFLRFDEPSKARLIKLMRSGQSPPLPTIDDVPDYEVRLFIFEQAVGMVLVDGRPNEHEREYLREIAITFDLSQPDVKDALARAQKAAGP